MGAGVLDPTVFLNLNHLENNFPKNRKNTFHAS